MQVSVDLYGEIVSEAEFQAPACPLPATAPTMAAEVTACANENGGAIGVTVTNPPGGSESHFEVAVFEAAGFPPEGDASFWSYRSEVSPGDGEDVAVVVDELTFRSPTDEAGRVQPLAAGDYLVQLSWAVADYGSLTTNALITVPACAPSAPAATEVRLASFNASLTRVVEGQLATDLSTPDDPQAAAVAEIIQRTRPDVLLLNDFDYDANGEALDLFRTNYLEVAQNGAEAIEYPYVFTAPVNSGVASGFDLDHDGTVGGSDDALGFGDFPGQHAMVVLSRYPILDDDVRTFQHLLWTAMPGARLPDDPATPEPADWYTADELAVLPLASASMWDVPVNVDGTTLHVLAAQPTTPTAPSPDGVSSPAALRNADEIRFWADYVAGDDTSWIVDDAGRPGGLGVDADFVIVGDLNADPIDGDSVDGAIQQLLDLDGVHDPLPTSEGGPEAALLQAGANATQQGNPAVDTADLADDPAPGNLRADYVLPSDGFDIVDAGVFWPASDGPLAALVAGDPPASSDHRLVWVDLTTPAAIPDTITTGPTTERRRRRPTTASTTSSTCPNSAAKPCAARAAAATARSAMSSPTATGGATSARGTAPAWSSPRQCSST